MLVSVIRRLAFVIPISLAVSAVCFALVFLAPGDPLSTRGSTRRHRHRRDRRLGAAGTDLDRPHLLKTC
jgi:ABC-type microcin C transport system permease subunit YejB